MIVVKIEKQLRPAWHALSCSVIKSCQMRIPDSVRQDSLSFPRWSMMRDCCKIPTRTSSPNSYVPVRPCSDCDASWLPSATDQCTATASHRLMSTSFSDGVVAATMEHRCCRRFTAAAADSSVVPEVESDSEDDEVAFIADSATARENVETSNEFLLHCPVSSLRQEDAGTSYVPGCANIQNPIIQTWYPQPTTGIDPVQAIANSLSKIEVSRQPECLLLHPPSSPPPALVQHTHPSSPPQLAGPGAPPATEDVLCAHSASNKNAEHHESSLAAMASLNYTRPVLQNNTDYE